MNQKGYRVSAPEVEAMLHEHATVIGTGVSDPNVGKRIKAIVFLKGDAGSRRI